MPGGLDVEQSRQRYGVGFLEGILRLGFGAKLSLAWIMAIRGREWRMWQAEFDETRLQGRV